MKKSWKSPGILFSHSHTNPVLTLCFACCRCVVLSLNCFVPIHTTVILTVCYINRQPGRGYHYSDTNACGESAASDKHLEVPDATLRIIITLAIYNVLFIAQSKCPISVYSGLFFGAIIEHFFKTRIVFSTKKCLPSPFDIKKIQISLRYNFKLR